MNLDNKAITKSPSRRSSPNNNINNNKTDSEPLYPEDHNLTLEDHLNERKENFDKNEGLLRPNILNECDININANNDVKSDHSNNHQDDYITVKRKVITKTYQISLRKKETIRIVIP